MSVRTEALKNLEKHKTLHVATGRKERRIWRKLHRAQEKLDKAREKFIEHHQAQGYTLWIMGGSRYEADSPEAQRTAEITHAVVDAFQGINIGEGAGPGIMDAATQAFRGSAGRNYAVGLQVSWEEKRDLQAFDYYVNQVELMPRVQELADLSNAVYVGPGALGTGFEFFTVMQLMQIKHLEPSYAIIVDPSWQPIVDACKKQWFTDRVADGKTPLMDEHNLDFFFSDNPADIVDHLAKSHDVWHERIGKKVRRNHFLNWNRKI